MCSNFSLKPEDQRSQSLCRITSGKARKVNSNDPGHLLFFIIVSLGRARAFSRDFTTIFAPECRAFSGALEIEKLKAPLIPGPKGAGDTNDWCITSNEGSFESHFHMSLVVRKPVFGVSDPVPHKPGSKTTQDD